MPRRSASSQCLPTTLQRVSVFEMSNLLPTKGDANSTSAVFIGELRSKDSTVVILKSDKSLRISSVLVTPVANDCNKGNIPYGLTEEQVSRVLHMSCCSELISTQIVHILSSAGQVISFRLVYDADTGRPKGFGFAEFIDADAAASAVRNLCGYEVMGRELRVDFSHKGDKEENNPQSQQTQVQQQAPPPQNGYNVTVPPPPQANGLPPLPPGQDLEPGLTCPDAISKTLNTLPPPQLLDILSQMKGLVMADPGKATELLSKAPQLSYAIFQALLLMNLIEPQVLAGVIEQSQQPPPQAPPPQHIPPPRPTPVGAYGQPPPPQQQYGGYPPPPQHMQPPMGHVPTPPVQGGMYQPPTQQIPPPQPSQEDLLKQLLNLPQHEIDRLPPAERQQIMDLRQRLAAGGRL